jgi:hypothetical protein
MHLRVTAFLSNILSMMKNLEISLKPMRRVLYKRKSEKLKAGYQVILKQKQRHTKENLRILKVSLTQSCKRSILKAVVLLLEEPDTLEALDTLELQDSVVLLAHRHKLHQAQV